MLTFEEDLSGEKLKLITWDKVSLQASDIKEHPVKKITIEIPAGGIAYVVVERFANANAELFTLNENGDKVPLTYIERWALCETDVAEDKSFKIRREL